MKRTRRFLSKYLSLCLFAGIIFLTAGFQISCPPPETLEGIDTNFNPAFHDGVSNGDYYAPPKINAVAVDPRTGNFFVGGSFNSIDNVPAVNIAFYDKTRDRFVRLFGKGVSHSSVFQSSYVSALAISGEYLYVGGSFSQTANAAPVTGLNNIVRYYIGSGSLDDVSAGFFSPIAGGGLNGEVNALEVFDDDLYVGGSFSNISSGSVSGLNNIARYAGLSSCVSNCWSRVHEGFNSTVYTLEKGERYEQPVLYIGGEFTTLIGSTLTVNRLTAYRPADNAMMELPGLNAAVKALAFGNGRIYAGGSFTKNDDDNLDLNRIAYFHGGSDWQPLPENGLNGEVKALAIYEYLVFVGGDFTQTVAGMPTALSRIACFDSHPDEQTWNNFASGLNDTVSALAVEDTGSEIKRLIIGGNFTRYGDNLGEYLKRVLTYNFHFGAQRKASIGNSVPGNWSPLGLPNDKALDGAVNAVAADDSSGNVYAGGLFTKTANGATTLNRIARYNPATKTWSPLANGGLNDTVESIIVVGDNLYVGGYFSATADGAVTNLNRMARYDLTTNTWSPVGNNGLFGFSTVSAFAVKDNNLYVGGNFTRTFDNAVTDLNYLAIYDLKTNTWSPFANNGMNANVNTLAIVGDDLYIGGGFTSTFDNSHFLFRITRYNLTDQTWFEFANSGLNSEARRMTVSGNYVFVNGAFSRTRDNTIILDSLARYDIANNSWAMMPGDAGTRNAAIRTHSMTQVGNDLFVGGNFHGAGDSVAHFFTQVYLQQWKVSASTSDWFNNANWTFGTVPANNSNAVIPEGAGIINIDSADVTLGDLNFNDGTLNIGAGRALTINGILSLKGGAITGDGTLVIANCRPDGILGGDSSAYIQTALVRCVNDSATFNFPVGTVNGYSPVTVKGITGTGNLSVRANQGAYSNPAAGLPANRQARWWRIENPGGGITNANLHFNYLESDLTGNETGYCAYRIAGGTASSVTGTVNPFSNIVTAAGVNGFSDWTLAELAPSSANVSVSGRVLTATGRGIGKVAVALTASDGSTRTVLTSSFGYYKFDNLEAGETYVIAVNHKRFVFNQNSMVITPGENLENLNFIEKAGSLKRFVISRKTV